MLAVRVIAAMMLIAACSQRTARSRADNRPWREVHLAVPPFAEETARIETSLLVPGVFDVRLEAGAFCVCEHPQLTCEIQRSPVPGIAFVLNGPSSGWPAAPAPLGACNVAGRSVVLDVVPDLESTEPYWIENGDVAVPLFAGQRPTVRVWTLPLPDDVPADAVEAEPGIVACRIDQGSRTLTISAPTETAAGDYDCISWAGGAARARVVPRRAP